MFAQICFLFVLTLFVVTALPLKDNDLDDLTYNVRQHIYDELDGSINNQNFPGPPGKKNYQRLFGNVDKVIGGIVLDLINKNVGDRLARNLDSIGGGNLVRAIPDNYFDHDDENEFYSNTLKRRNLDPIGGGHLVRSLNINDRELLPRNLDSIGGGHLVRSIVADSDYGNEEGKEHHYSKIKRGNLEIILNKFDDDSRARGTLDSIGGGNLIRRRNLDSIGGGNLVRAIPDNYFDHDDENEFYSNALKRRNLDSIGGGNLVRSVNINDRELLPRNLDSIGGGNLVRSIVPDSDYGNDEGREHHYNKLKRSSLDLILKRFDDGTVGTSSLDSIGGGNLIKRRNLDSIGGGTKVMKLHKDMEQPQTHLRNAANAQHQHQGHSQQQQQTNRYKRMETVRLNILPTLPSSDDDSDLDLKPLLYNYYFMNNGHLPYMDYDINDMKKNFDEIDRSAFDKFLFNKKKRTFDEIDRMASFNDFNTNKNRHYNSLMRYPYKRNSKYDENDYHNYNDFIKRNFDEIDRLIDFQRF